MQVLALLFSLLVSNCLASTAWDLNDVSILMNLKHSGNGLISPVTVGKDGVFFPKSYYEHIGVLNQTSDIGSKNYENLRAIAFRFDPCPRDKNNSAKNCKPEFRIVWQPVVRDSSNTTWTTEDAAIHTFHILSNSEFQNIKTGLKNLKAKMETLGVSTHQKALGIHPALLNAKTAKIFQKDFFELIKSNLGAHNFAKFTFMRLLVAENWWKFLAGFEKNPQGELQRSTISSHGGFEMDIINDATEVNPETNEVDEVDASLFIVQSRPSDEDLRNIVSTSFRRTFSSANPDVRDFAQFKTTLQAVNKFQNPDLSNPNNLDCLSCHYADTAHKFAIKVFPNLKGFVQGQENYYQPAHQFNRTNETIAMKSSRVVRAFGYFEDKPSVMTRTINDSIDSASWLNTQE